MYISDVRFDILRSGSRGGYDSDGYNPSSGERTRLGTPKEDTPRGRWDEAPRSGGSHRGDSGRSRHDEDDRSGGDDKWEEKNDHLLRQGEWKKSGVYTEKKAKFLLSQ